jgi:hypothetical protein
MTSFTLTAFGVDLGAILRPEGRQGKAKFCNSSKSVKKNVFTPTKRKHIPLRIIPKVTGHFGNRVAQEELRGKFG